MQVQAYYRLTTTEVAQPFYVAYYKYITGILQVHYRITTDLLHAGQSLKYTIHTHTHTHTHTHDNGGVILRLRGYC